MSVSPPCSRFETAVELAKWLAVLTMVVDHVGFLLLHNDPAFRFVGRAAFPLFCWVIALRLAERPARAGRYLPRLVQWGLISQIPFWLAFYPGDSLFAWCNIMATLGLGVAGVILMDRLTAAKERGAPSFHGAALWVGMALALFAGGRCDYGSLGVAALPLLTAWARTDVRQSARRLGALGVVINVAVTLPFLLQGGGMSALVLSLGALLATPLALLCLSLAGVSGTGRPLIPSLPRMPGWFFYGFYPAHILLLTLVATRVFGLMDAPFPSGMPT